MVELIANCELDQWGWKYSEFSLLLSLGIYFGFRILNFTIFVGFGEK